MFVDGKQQHARQIRIVGRLGFWWGCLLSPDNSFPMAEQYTHTHN